MTDPNAARAAEIKEMLSRPSVRRAIRGSYEANKHNIAEFTEAEIDETVEYLIEDLVEALSCPITAALDEAEARGLERAAKMAKEAADEHWRRFKAGEGMEWQGRSSGAIQIHYDIRALLAPSPAAQPVTEADRQDSLIASYFGVTVEEVRRVRAGERPATPADGRGE